MNADEVRRGWATRSREFSPAYYAYYGPNEASEQVRLTLDRLVGPDAAVLELGCSAGRHLAHLHDHGYTNLSGVDINDDAIDVLTESYPALAADGTFYHDAIERVVDRFDDGGFDAVFTVETLQHVHRDDAWVFEAIARLTDDVLVTVEAEEPDGGSDGEGRVDGESAGEGPSDGGSDGERSSDGGSGETAADSAAPPAGWETSVHTHSGDFPLYYRPWGRIFTGFGMEAVASRPVGRDRLRAFRWG